MRLFLHSGRRVVLTDEGRLFLPYAKEMIHVYQAGKQKVSQWKQGTADHSLAVHPHIASYILPRFLPAHIQKIRMSSFQLMWLDLTLLNKRWNTMKLILVCRGKTRTPTLYYQHI